MSVERIARIGEIQSTTMGLLIIIPPHQVTGATSRVKMQLKYDKRKDYYYHKDCHHHRGDYNRSSNLKDFQIKMPANYIQGGGGDNTGKMTSNLDVITGMAALGMLDQMNPAGAKKAAGSDSSSSCTVS